EVLGFKAEATPKVNALAVAAAEAFIRQRLEQRWDIYDQYFWNTTVSNAAAMQGETNKSKVADGSRASFLAWMVPLRVHYNSYDVEGRGVLSDRAADNAWQWSRAPRVRPGGGRPADCRRLTLSK